MELLIEVTIHHGRDGLEGVKLFLMLRLKIACIPLPCILCENPLGGLSCCWSKGWQRGRSSPGESLTGWRLERPGGRLLSSKGEILSKGRRGPIEPMSPRCRVQDLLVSW